MHSAVGSTQPSEARGPGHRNGREAAVAAWTLVCRHRGAVTHRPWCRGVPNSKTGTCCLNSVTRDQGQVSRRLMDISCSSGKLGPFAQSLGPSPVLDPEPVSQRGAWVTSGGDCHPLSPHGTRTGITNILQHTKKYIFCPSDKNRYNFY